METETPSDTGTETGFDMDTAVDTIGGHLFPDPPAPPTDEPDGEVALDVTAPAVPSADPSAPVLRAVPKSWPKEMHEHWGKADPKIQDYWETREKQMLDGLEQYKADAQMAKQFLHTLTPYQQTIKNLGLDPVTAAQKLFEADHALRYAAPEQKRAYLLELAKAYGIETGGLTQSSATTQAPVDPVIQSLQTQIQAIQSNLTARQQADLTAAQEKASKEVEAFASDPAHAQFNEVADDIVSLLKAGLSLQEAYDTAVWKNPLTREKNLQARLLQETEKQKENARLEALPKAKAARANIRSVESRRTPTEPLGSMKETMLDTLKEIRSRAS